MIKEHDRVVLTTPASTEGLEAGDVGTVVHVYRDGLAFEVEFTTLAGKTAAVVTLEGSDPWAVERLRTPANWPPFNLRWPKMWKPAPSGP